MRIAFLVVSCLLMPCCFAAELFCGIGKVHPIDADLEREISKSGGVTSAIRDAQGKAYERWDKELNKAYRDLMSVLKPKDREILKQSQRAWLAYRDAEANLWWAEGLYGGGGTLAPVAVGDRSRGVLRQRVCELIEYRTLSEHGGI